MHTEMEISLNQAIAEIKEKQLRIQNAMKVWAILG
jgi:hypothetical protein